MWWRRGSFLEKWFQKITFLGLIRLDGKNGKVELYAANPAGGKNCLTRPETPEVLESYSWMPFLEEKYQKNGDGDDLLRAEPDPSATERMRGVERD